MATKKNGNKEKEVTLTNQSNVAVMPATIVSQSEKRGADVALPDFLQDEGSFDREAPDGFSPLIDFKEIGNWIVARFVGMRGGIGPNKSFMYDFAVQKPDKSMMLAALWGSTILDTKMMQLKPDPGDFVFIQYLGVVDTSRGMNPAKDFRLKIVSKQMAQKMGLNSDALGFA